MAKKVTHRNRYHTAMITCHPRKQVHKHRTAKRSKDARKSWQRDWDSA